MKWKTIKGFEDYEISENGDIRVLVARRWTTFVGKQLKLKKGGYKKRYLRITLYKDHKGYDRLVHRLVAENFIEPEPLGMQIAHLDGNPHNNHYTNLKWCSPKENSSHKILHGTSGKGSTNSSAKLKDSDVLEILSKYLQGSSSVELANEFNVSIGNIRAIISRKTWLHLPISSTLEESLKIQRKKNMIEAPRRVKWT